MKKICIMLLVMWVVLMGVSPVVRAEHSQPPADTSSPELNRIKSLAGKWTATTSMFGTPNQRIYTEFAVTSGGSVVLERIFPGTPEEMVSVYYDDNGKLAMTHYCIMRNRPTLTLASSNADTITLDVKKIEGMKSKKDPSMGGVTLQFKDKNHIVATCRAKGKGHEQPMAIEYSRVK